jgi:hypothetical protein
MDGHSRLSKKGAKIVFYVSRTGSPVDPLTQLIGEIMFRRLHNTRSHLEDLV